MLHPVSLLRIMISSRSGKILTKGYILANQSNKIHVDTCGEKSHMGEKVAPADIIKSGEREGTEGGDSEDKKTDSKNWVQEQEIEKKKGPKEIASLSDH